jgi:hypothetical protein
MPEIPNEVEETSAAGLLAAQFSEVTLDFCLLRLGVLFAVEPIH